MESLIYRATEILAFSRLLCLQSKGHPNICHLTNHVIWFKPSISICMPLKGMKCYPCHHAQWKSTLLMERGEFPVQHFTMARTERLSFWHWPHAELLIFFRLKRLFAANTSLPKDNFIILIIRCPVMIKCLLLAPVWSFLLTSCLLWQTIFVMEKVESFTESSKKVLS